MRIVRVLIPHWIFPLEYASAVHQIVFIETLYNQSYDIVVMILFKFYSIHKITVDYLEQVLAHLVFNLVDAVIFEHFH